MLKAKALPPAVLAARPMAFMERKEKTKARARSWTFSTKDQRWKYYIAARNTGIAGAIAGTVAAVLKNCSVPRRFLTGPVLVGALDSMRGPAPVELLPLVNAQRIITIGLHITAALDTLSMRHG